MISIVKPDPSYSRHNLTVQCPCGRTLRAKVELAGTEIQCWDCHRKVPVPFPRSAIEGFRAFRKAWDDVFETVAFVLLVAAAAVITGLMAVPRAGVLLGTVAFVAVAFGYGMMMRRGDGAETVEEESPVEEETFGLQRWLACGAVALVSGLGLNAPFLLARGGIGHPAQLAGFLVPCLTTGTMVFLPLATLATFDHSGRRVLASVLRRRRWSVLSALAILPLSLVLLECALVFTTFFLGLFGGLMIDLIPTPFGLRERIGIPRDWFFGLGRPSDVQFLSLYWNRLGHGYTLTGAIPPSLALPGQIRIQYWANTLAERTYFIARAGLTLLIMTCLLSALAFQARCLGRIARLEGRLLAKRAPAAAVPSPTA